MSAADRIPKADLYDCCDTAIVTCEAPAEAIELWLNVLWDPARPDRSRTEVIRESAPVVLHCYRRDAPAPELESLPDEDEDELFDLTEVGQVELQAGEIEKLLREYRGVLSWERL
jgi:hypothetical protein